MALALTQQPHGAPVQPLQALINSINTRAAGQPDVGGGDPDGGCGIPGLLGQGAPQGWLQADHQGGAGSQVHPSGPARSSQLLPRPREPAGPAWCPMGARSMSTAILAYVPAHRPSFSPLPEVPWEKAKRMKSSPCKREKALIAPTPRRAAKDKGKVCPLGVTTWPGSESL